MCACFRSIDNHNPSTARSFCIPPFQDLETSFWLNVSDFNILDRFLLNRLLLYSNFQNLICRKRLLLVYQYGKHSPTVKFALFLAGLFSSRPTYNTRMGFKILVYGSCYGVYSNPELLLNFTRDVCWVMALLDRVFRASNLLKILTRRFVTFVLFVKHGDVNYFELIKFFIKHVTYPIF